MLILLYRGGRDLIRCVKSAASIIIIMPMYAKDFLMFGFFGEKFEELMALWDINIMIYNARES